MYTYLLFVPTVHMLEIWENSHHILFLLNIFPITKFAINRNVYYFVFRNLKIVIFYCNNNLTLNSWKSGELLFYDQTNTSMFYLFNICQFSLMLKQPSSQIRFIWYFTMCKSDISVVLLHLSDQTYGALIFLTLESTQKDNRNIFIC